MKRFRYKRVGEPDTQPGQAQSHPSRWVLKVSIMLNIMAYAFYLSYCFEFANKGFANSNKNLVGDVLWAFGEVCMTCLLMAFGKGWTIYRCVSVGSCLSMGVSRRN
jgi:hypothetical protein